jgi:hypothetical protein
MGSQCLSKTQLLALIYEAYASNIPLTRTSREVSAGEQAEWFFIRLQMFFEKHWGSPQFTLATSSMLVRLLPDLDGQALTWTHLNQIITLSTFGDLYNP